MKNLMTSEDEETSLIVLPPSAAMMTMANLYFPGINVSLMHDGTNHFLSIEDCVYVRELNFSLANVTCLEHAPVLTPEARVRVIVLLVMTVVSLIGNLATIISISRDKRQSRTTVYTLIHQLAVSDLFVTFACLLTESVWTYTVQWLAGDVMCKLMKWLQMFSLYVSTFILVLIGVDRFMAVRYPLRHSETHRRCGYGLVFVWAFSGILSLPQMVIFRVARGPFIEEFYQCVTYGFYTEVWQEQLYTTFSLVFMFILPLLTLLVTYSLTFVTLKKSEKIFREFSTNLQASCPDFNRRRLLRKAKMKALKISLVIVIAFVVCWTPYFTMMLIHIFFQPGEMLSQELQKGVFFFGMSNSLVNPVIYGAFHLCKCSKRSTSSFNMIILQRSGQRLQYKANTRRSSRTSSRSTHGGRSGQNPLIPNKVDNPQSATSLLNYSDKGVRYSFKQPFTRMNPQMEPTYRNSSFRKDKNRFESNALISSKKKNGSDLIIE